MKQAQHPPLLQTTKGDLWKRCLVDAVLVITVVALLTFVIFALRLHAVISTILLVYLFIVLWLLHQRGFWTAVLAAFAACIAFDFFLIQPRFSLTIQHLEEGFDLFVFLLFVTILGYFYSRVREKKRQQHDASTLYEERLRKQSEEVTRQDYEVGIFYNVVQVTRDKNDLKYQLGFITKTLEETFSFCGLRSCVIFIPDLE